MISHLGNSKTHIVNGVTGNHVIWAYGFCCPCPVPVALVVSTQLIFFIELLPAFDIVQSIGGWSLSAHAKCILCWDVHIKQAVESCGRARYVIIDVGCCLDVWVVGSTFAVRTHTSARL